MEHGSVEVAHVDRVLNDVIAEVIGLAVVHPTLDSSPSQPAGEATWMVVAPVICARDVALAIHGAPEFPDTNNQRIIKEASVIFDFKLMARLSLAKKWKAISKAQRKEFTALFVKRIQQSYLEKLNLYTDEEVIIEDAKKTKKKRVELKTFLVSEDDKKEMIYKFRKHKKRGWLVYDVNILGVSFIQTYRSQFSGVLKNKSMDELIEDLKNPEQS